MPNTPPQTLSKISTQLLAAATALFLSAMSLQARPAALVNDAGYDIACSIQDATEIRTCEQEPPSSACNAEGSYASAPSREPTGISLVNRSDQPVKIYWLNFQGQRVLYKTLPPGGQHTQQTFIGHNWLVATMTEQCLEIFETSPESFVAEGVATVAPPEFPEYEQPPPPEDNLIWTPGYWAWNEDMRDYYWVPGTWVAAPIVGYLWTPGYWIVRRGLFAWRAGYWGPHIGFYGGINYGYGYFGRGYAGGSWRDGRMMYNSAVTNLGHFQSTNTYNQPVANNAPISRLAYGGGGHGAQPTAAELAAASEIHIPPTAAQLQQSHAARNNPSMRASLNNGHPPIGATPRPAEFSSPAMPPAPHAGTLSIMHSNPPAHPAQALRSAAPYTAASAPTALTSAPVHAQMPVHAPRPQEHVARAPAEPQAAKETAQPAKKSTPAPARAAPHTQTHPP